MKRYLAALATAIALYASTGFACQADFQCGPQASCIMQQGGYEGYCSQPMQQVNQGYQQVIQPSYVNKGCNSQYDCSYGQSCFKVQGQMIGICIN